MTYLAILGAAIALLAIRLLFRKEKSGDRWVSEEGLRQYQRDEWSQGQDGVPWKWPVEKTKR